MLCECTNMPGAISVAANPITTLYLRIGSPFLIAHAATLLPAGTWLLTLRPSRSSFAPIGRSCRAMTTLSFSCRRMARPAAGLSLTSITGDLLRFASSEGAGRRARRTPLSDPEVYGTLEGHARLRKQRLTNSRSGRRRSRRPDGRRGARRSRRDGRRVRTHAVGWTQAPDGGQRRTQYHAQRAGRGFSHALRRAP